MESSPAGAQLGAGSAGGSRGGPLKPKDASHSAQGQGNTASKDSFPIRGALGRLGRLEVTTAREGFPGTLG